MDAYMHHSASMSLNITIKTNTIAKKLHDWLLAVSFNMLLSTSIPSPLLLTWFNFNPGMDNLTWMSNHMPSKVWDEIDM